jgi:hypothetical protein
MSSNDENNRKRKATIIPDAVSSFAIWNPKEESNKARRVSTNALASPAASLQVDTLVATASAAAAAKQEESMESSGQIIQDLFYSDNAIFSDTLQALYDFDFDEDKKKCESLVAAGICLALVWLIKNRLKKARKQVPACDQVTEINDDPLLETLLRTLGVIRALVCTHKESRPLSFRQCQSQHYS